MTTENMQMRPWALPEVTAEERAILERVAKLNDLSDRTSWKRKESNINKIIEKVQPLQDQILELQLEVRKYYDEIEEYRSSMVDTCIHPVERTRVVDWDIATHYVVMCEFCNKSITVSK